MLIHLRVIESWSDNWQPIGLITLLAWVKLVTQNQPKLWVDMVQIGAPVAEPKISGEQHIPNLEHQYNPLVMKFLY